MSESGFVSAQEIIDEHGPEMLDRMLDYGFHHTDLRRPAAIILPPARSFSA
jgi:hypothetical protein